MRISSCTAMQIAAEHRNTIKVLSERRVEITKRFLVGRGIPETNLSTKAYGEEDNMTPE
jgi:outer membrane protein OmpA-like peptidoglycan-associated protein